MTPVERSCSIVSFRMTNSIIAPNVVVAVFVSLTVSLHYIILFVFAVFFLNTIVCKAVWLGRQNVHAPIKLVHRHGIIIESENGIM